jgi:hypothetical protein
MGYYAIQAYTQADPCTGMQWDWGEALFWSGVGTGLGAALGVGIYGGWWVGIQAGWWGPATVTGGGVAAQQAGQTAIQVAQNNPQKVAHIFNNPMHNWHVTGQSTAGNWNLIQQTIAANYQQIISSPTPFEVSAVFGNVTVTVRGMVVNGVIRIGTAFANPMP